MKKFEKIFNESEILLTGGAIGDRMETEFNIDTNATGLFAEIVYEQPEILELLFRQYIDIGQKHNRPILVTPLTRGVNFETIKGAKYKDRNIISDSFHFLNKIRDSYGDYSQHILIGGLLGCKGDAYSSKNALGREASYKFHSHQTQQFKKEDYDFLFAGIMPEVNEAIGMAQAMADTEIPYIISFMIRKNGCLIDGTSISDAIKIIDREVDQKPICYMTNCIHPTNLKLALTDEKNIGRPELSRFKGIMANASSLSPEELDNCGVLHREDFDIMINEMQLLREQFNLKILGGCCGTNDAFLNGLSNNLANTIHKYN